jgi:tetratricopeptide (TPR) repeat protein
MQRLEEAAHYFQICFKRFPKNDRVLFEYANFVRDRGNVKAALKLYQKAVLANPGHSLAVFNMGILYAQAGEPERGLNFIDRAIRLNPENRSFHVNLSRLPLPTALLPAAALLLERYVEKSPDAVDCLDGLADMQFKLDQFERAQELANRALALEPARVSSLLTRANSQHSLGRLAQAEDSYHAVLRIDSNNLDSLMNLAAIAETRGEKAQARSWYLRVLQAHPGQPQALMRFATNQTSAVVDSETAAVLERACPSDLRDPQCLLLVGSLLERAGKVSTATELYRSAARQKPDWAGMIHRKIEQLNFSNQNGGTFNVPISS